MQNPLSDIIASLRSVQASDDIHAACANIADAYGFDHFFFAARFPSSFVKPFVLVISDYPIAWQERYGAQNYLALDPTVTHCAHSVRPLVWNELEPLDDLEPQIRQLIDEARGYGLRSGFTVPVHGAQGEVSTLSLATPLEWADSAPRIEQALAPVHLLAAHVHEAACRLVDSAQLPFHRPLLTQRERECLLWAAEGKTSWETAQIVGISERTVIFHLQHVAEKLGCANRQQAVARAIAQGLLVPLFA